MEHWFENSEKESGNVLVVDFEPGDRFWEDVMEDYKAYMHRPLEIMYQNPNSPLGIVYETVDGDGMILKGVTQAYARNAANEVQKKLDSEVEKKWGEFPSDRGEWELFFTHIENIKKKGDLVKMLNDGNNVLVNFKKSDGFPGVAVKKNKIFWNNLDKIMRQTIYDNVYDTQEDTQNYPPVKVKYNWFESYTTADIINNFSPEYFESTISGYN